MTFAPKLNLSTTMKRIGIFYGSATGNTEAAAQEIKQAFGDGADLFNVDGTPASKVAEYDNVILGTSTWGVGDLEDSMSSFVDDLNKVNLNGKTIALFGMGDQNCYSDTYCDGMGHLYEAVDGKGATIVGAVDTDGYDYSSSTAVVNDEFVGLALDADNQADKTTERINAWVAQLKEKFQ